MMNGPPRYAFFGTGFFAARCLELLSEWSPPEWVVTSSPGASRKGLPVRTPAGEFAEKFLSPRGVPTAESGAASSDEAVLELRRVRPVDFAFVVDFGQLIREPLLGWNEPVGCLNIHPSSLPLYRGAAPLQRALMDGADSVGVSVFKLAAKMDSGPILLSVDVPVSPDDDFGSLRTKTAEAGVAAFVKFASERPADTWAFSPQDESLATFAPKISAAEERIDWTRGAPAISRQIRALSPKPGAWTTLRGKRVLILSAREAADLSAGGQPGELLHSGKFLAVQAGEGAIELTSVQTEGKKPQPASAWRNGLRISPGECFV